MLKPIHHVPCAPALYACRRLQVHLLAWLCDPAVDASDVTQANLQPPHVPTQIEANWLWGFLQREMSHRPLLERAQVLAEIPAAEKAALHSWGQTTSAIADQFQPNPPTWPQAKPAIHCTVWKAFKELMEAFYEKGLNSTNGIPYLSDGTPTAGGGVTYAQFMQEFRDTHRLNQNSDAREVCVLCGGPLGQTPEVDHWVAKSAYPLLSVCADNLLPICGDCNSTSNKGEKPVNTLGVFDDWFHPYLRHANGEIRLDYNLQPRTVTVAANSEPHAAKITNLDKLLNLGTRWTRELKAEYAKQQGVLIEREKRRVNRGEARHTEDEILAHITTARNGLLQVEPNYEVHKTLFDALLNQSCLDSWYSELRLIQKSMK